MHGHKGLCPPSKLRELMPLVLGIRIPDLLHLPSPQRHGIKQSGGLSSCQDPWPLQANPMCENDEEWAVTVSPFQQHFMWPSALSFCSHTLSLLVGKKRQQVSVRRNNWEAHCPFYISSIFHLQQLQHGSPLTSTRSLWILSSSII